MHLEEHPQARAELRKAPQLLLQWWRFALLLAEHDLMVNEFEGAIDIRLQRTILLQNTFPQGLVRPFASGSVGRSVGLRPVE
jgi:hypothetical protein